MNKSVLLSLTTTALAVVGGYFIKSGVITVDQWSSISQDLNVAIPALVVALIGVWKATRHTDASVVVSASNVAGVEPIKVNTDVASPSVSAVAASDAPAHANVTPAA